jgi:hypothetical protein
VLYVRTASRFCPFGPETVGRMRFPSPPLSLPVSVASGYLNAEAVLFRPKGCQIATFARLSDKTVLWLAPSGKINKTVKSISLKVFNNESK